jgi:hypothetical protein
MGIIFPIEGKLPLGITIEYSIVEKQKVAY